MLARKVDAREQRLFDVVQSLCDAPTDGRVVALGSGAAFVAMPDGSTVLVISAGRGPIDELEHHLRKLVHDNRRADLKLVIVGGDAQHRELLVRVQPRLMLGRVVQVFALGDDREPWAGPRSRLDSPTGRVLAEVGARVEPREVDVAALRATIELPTEAQLEAGAEQRGFAQKLAQGRPHATMAIVTGYALVYALELVWGGSESMPTLWHMGASAGDVIADEPWRLLSASWLHAGWLHLVVNGYVMYVLGGFLERLLGWPRLLLVYAASALGGGLATALLSDAALSVGASGAIWGLLGTTIALALRPAGVIPPSVVPILRRNALVNAAINLAASLLPQVDLMAHLGGGLVGLAIGLAGLTTRGLVVNDPARGDRRLRPFALAAIAVHLAALATAIISGHPWRAPQLDDVRAHELPTVHATITVPTSIGAPIDRGPLAETDDDATLTGGAWRFGDPRRDRLGLELGIVRLDGTHTRSPAELTMLADEILKADLDHDPALTMVGTRHLLDDTPFPTIEERTLAPSGIRIITWWQLRPDGELRLDGWYHPGHRDTEPALRAALDSIRW